MTAHSNLLPREHGAYAELGFPLATGLALAVPSWPALALGAAAIALFLANEPVAILLGARGKRILEQEGRRARVRMRALLGLGGFLAGMGLVGAGDAVWPAVLIPAVAAAFLIPTVLAGKQKTIPGELLVVTTFSTVLLPLAAASNVPMIRAGLAACVWWTSFALATLQVHAIKARHKNRGRGRWTVWGSPLASGLTLLAALWVALGQASPTLGKWARGASGTSGSRAMGENAAPLADGAWWAWEAMRHLPPAAAALLPPALAILILHFLRVHPRHLKRVGWTLVGVNTLTLVLLLQG
jgi:hypothetical protein